jgi:hypothetical protein
MKKGKRDKIIVMKRKPKRKLKRIRESYWRG